jgi:Protein kinase domain
LLHDAAEVFDYLHHQTPPIIHRDIKPVNIIENAAGRFCLVDLGAATERLAGDAGSTVVGTFGYMAPEQFQGRASPASDVYALGATLLTLLTGLEPERLPHAGLGIDVRRALGDRVDVRLRTLLERMLEPDPERRPAELRPLLRALPRTGASPPSGERRAAPAASEPGAARASRSSHAPGLPRRHGPPALPGPLLILVREIALPVLLGLIALVTLLLFALLNVLGKRHGAADVRKLGLDLGQGIQRLRQDMGTPADRNETSAEKAEPEAPVEPGPERRWRRRATRSRERHWG